MKLLSMGSAVALALSSALVQAHTDHDPRVNAVVIDELEYRHSDAEEAIGIDADIWSGRDLNKLWFKLEGERASAEDKALELQALYSTAIAPYWDLQLGVRHDIRPEPSRSWAVLGLQGLAPYFFEVDAALFIGESGRSALRLEAEYELLLTQRLILSPEIELNLYGQDDEDMHIGSGLAEAEAGLRLRYEIRRELAPYVGVSYRKHFGNTADMLRDAGEDASQTEWLLGLRTWF